METLDLTKFLPYQVESLHYFPELAEKLNEILNNPTKDFIIITQKRNNSNRVSSFKVIYNKNKFTLRGMIVPLRGIVIPLNCSKCIFKDYKCLARDIFTIGACDGIHDTIMCKCDISKNT